MCSRMPFSQLDLISLVNQTIYFYTFNTWHCFSHIQRNEGQYLEMKRTLLILFSHH